MRGDKLANKAVMRKAEEIRAQRIVDLQNEKFNFLDKQAGKTILVEWLEEQRKSCSCFLNGHEKSGMPRMEYRLTLI